MERILRVNDYMSSSSRADDNDELDLTLPCLCGALGSSAFSVGSRPPPAQLLGLLSLLLTLSQDLGVLGGGLTVLLPLPPLQSQTVTLPLEHGGRDQTLDLGGLEGGGLALLGRQRPLDDVLPDIIALAQVEELADVGGTLGSQTPGDGVVGQSGDLGLALLDDGQGQDGEVSVDDAAADGLALPLAGAALAVATVALLEEKADTALGHDALLHGESLLVVASGDAEDVTLPLVTQGVGGDLGAHTLLVKWTNLVFIVDFKQFLASRCREGHVELHGDAARNRST